MMNISYNQEKNGIEIRFDVKPSAEVLNSLRSVGFRWSSKQKMWYAKQSEKTQAVANEIAEKEGVIAMDTKVNHENKMNVDIWQLTRTESIGNNFEKFHLYSTKEIAAKIRAHLRSRFKLCKWSVTSDAHSINVHITEAPYAVDSDILNAIVHYAYVYGQSYNYDHSDVMTDYFDVNFYGIYESQIVDEYKFKQREATEEEVGFESEFLAKKEQFEAEERIREEEEFQKQMAQMEIEHQKAEEARKIAEENHAKIEAAVTTEDVDYFAMDCSVPDVRKLNNASDYDDSERHRENCKVSRNVYMSADIYDLFSNQLMDDYSFLAGMGGGTTEDPRIGSMIDYNMMDEAERKTVEWYNSKCVAIFCDGEMKMVVNPEGFDYARYTYFVDEATYIAQEYHPVSPISDEELERNKISAECIEDISTDIIQENHMEKTWFDEDAAAYRKAMCEKILAGHLRIDVGVIRAIEYERLKEQMYIMLTEVGPLRMQFKEANFSEGDMFTMVKIGDFGGISVTRGQFLSCVDHDYAQYKDSVKFSFRPERKRKDYYTYLHGDVIIYKGRYELPEDLFWEDVECDNGMRIRKTRYSSCDHGQYDAVLNYLGSQGIRPVINTYKPQF